jgi:hypothetical protein
MLAYLQSNQLVASLSRRRYLNKLSQALTSPTLATELARPATCDVKSRRQRAFSYQGL